MLSYPVISRAGEQTQRRTCEKAPVTQRVNLLVLVVYLTNYDIKCILRGGKKTIIIILTMKGFGLELHCGPLATWSVQPMGSSTRSANCPLLIRSVQ